MAVTSAGCNSCGREHSNHAYPVGPRPPGPVRLISGGVGSPGNLDGFNSEKTLPCKSNHSDLLPRLDSELCFDLHPWGGTLKLSLKQGLVTVKGNACRNRQPCSFQRHNFQGEEPAPNPQVLWFLPGWHLEIKVCLCPSGITNSLSRASPDSRSHDKQALENTK